MSERLSLQDFRCLQEREVAWGEMDALGHATEDGRLAAEGEAVVVWYNYAQGQKVPWPERVKAKLMAVVQGA